MRSWAAPARLIHAPMLVPLAPTTYLSTMQLPAPFLALLALILPAAAIAQPRPAHPAAHPAPVRPANVPKPIGKWDDWQAATHQESGATICYAFTRARASAPVLPGRGDVVLTVTQRPGGRDAVAISAGFAYPAGAEVQMQVDSAQLPFYTANRSAFARDGRAVAAAFERGRQAVARSPAPRAQSVSDTFSLRGFTPAYAAINKACPPR